jgi:hypothetical protein
MNWQDKIYESLIKESSASKAEKAGRNLGKAAKAAKTKKKAAKKAAAKARQITIDSGDPEVAHMLDPVNNPRRW